MKICTLFIGILAPISMAVAQPGPEHNLKFDKLAGKWDEAIPLGNGMMGALIWQKGDHMRLSLDRADLWDERKALDLNKFNFKWVEEQVLKNDYLPVQKLGDWPYDQSPYPTKLPAAAIEIDISSLGKVISNELDIAKAVSTIRFEQGAIFKAYVHATLPVGYFSFEQVDAKTLTGMIPQMMIPAYSKDNIQGTDAKSHSGEGLQKLGYAGGTVSKSVNSVRYRQPTYEGRYYEVLLQWKVDSGNKITGSWTISNNKPAVTPPSVGKGGELMKSHLAFWKDFWSKSSLSIPDALVEKQYYLEMYKLGSVARKGAPAITLQAVWTADNGFLPPWKGDFHNDLNTQLSYWPAYTGNRLEEAETFTDWLWSMKDKNLAYTRQYFGVEGLNVPGVATLSGDPMGGWIQYSLSPTVSAWCAQHFFWQWKYAMDDQFLKTRAYPYLHAAATYLENITRLENGKRKLPLGSSPEYHDNSIKAWYKHWTNFDLALVKYAFGAASEVATTMGKTAEGKHWLEIQQQLPEFDVNETGLTVAEGENMDESHRHLSPYMAIYPMALTDINNPLDKPLIENSLKQIEKHGTKAWCGYSFSWMASIYARAYKADEAVRQLQIFAGNFCSVNSFHVNGDQKGGQYSNFTYRPFTLEGNFAFAQGVHELLLQSRNGYIEVFPAVPQAWENVSFSSLRAEGAFLVSAKKEGGRRYSIKVKAEKDGLLNIKLPSEKLSTSAIYTRKSHNVISMTVKKGQVVVFTEK